MEDALRQSANETLQAALFLNYNYVLKCQQSCLKSFSDSKLSNNEISCLKSCTNSFMFADNLLHESDAAFELATAENKVKKAYIYMQRRYKQLASKKEEEF